MRHLVLIPFVLVFLSCGDIGPDGDVVGGECVDDRDCEETCLRKDDFPYGMCSIKCKSDHDCPSDTVCIDKEGGYCAYLCDENSDCREHYECKSKKRKSGGGSDPVCAGD